ncbi:MAG: hypothetical protein SNJ60_06060, partial [Pseudanabaenaceae cyanobacterium]
MAVCFIDRLPKTSNHPIPQGAGAILETAHHVGKAMGILVSPRRHIHDDSDVFYPIRDDEPLAETTLHADVILATVTTLRNYLRETASERSPVVLCDQFVYYAKGFPALRVAPDIAVLFGVPQIPYENYKIWETEVVPSAILEISS